MRGPLEETTEVSERVSKVRKGVEKGFPLEGDREDGDEMMDGILSWNRGRGRSIPSFSCVGRLSARFLWWSFTLVCR